MNRLKSLTQRLNSALLTVFITIVVSLSASHAAQADKLIDRIVAVVNNQIILKSELSDQMLIQQQSLSRQGIPLPEAQVLQQKVLDALILEKLQLERAEQLGIEISDEQLNEQLEIIAKQNKMSLVALRKRLNLETPNGFNALRQQIKNKLLIQTVREAEVLSQIQVSESEIQNFINRQALDNRQEELLLGHILIELPDSPTPQQRQAALQQAQNIHQRLQANEDFRELAVRYSDGSKALNGGSLGWLKRTEIPTFFTDAIAGLNVGDISSVIHSPSGFHIVKLIDQKTLNTPQHVTLYHLHRFLLPSDQAIRTQTPPSELATMVANINSLKDFHALVETYPEVPKSLNQHTDLGWKSLDELPPALQTKIQSMSPNRALPPLATQDGWVILFLDAIKTNQAKPEAQTQQAIQEIRMRKGNEIFERWLNRLKDEAFIKIHLNHTPS